MDLAGSRFERCLFQVPTLRGSDLSSAEFSDSRSEPTPFANCKLGGARFVGCALFGAGANKGCTFAFCELQATEIVRSNLSSGSFEDCALYGVSAVEGSFRGARFPRSTFTRAISKRSTLTIARFDRCNFSFADLSGLHLQGCEFLSCKLSEASLIDTDPSQATFLACALDRVEWDRAKLRKADLPGSNLSGLNLAVLADYAGVRISESEQAEILKLLGVDVDASTDG